MTKLDKSYIMGDKYMTYNDYTFTLGSYFLYIVLSFWYFWFGFLILFNLVIIFYDLFIRYIL